MTKAHALLFALALGLLAGCAATAEPEIAGPGDGAESVATDATPVATPGEGATPDAPPGRPADEVWAPDAGRDTAGYVPPPNRIALYDDRDAPEPAVWDGGVDLIAAALEGAGLGFDKLTRDALNDPDVELGAWQVLVFGGGFAYPGYTVHVEAGAKDRMRQFVAAGGVWVGICAGAYFACDWITWEGESFHDESGQDLDLLPGGCVGPLTDIAQWPNWGPTQVRFEPHAAWAQTSTVPFKRWVWYAGGPPFTAFEAQIDVLATWKLTGSQIHGLPAAVHVAHGEGHVFLLAPHLEVVGPDMPTTNPGLLASLIEWAMVQAPRAAGDRR